MTEPVPFLTVGDLKSDLGRWSDDTPDGRQTAWYMANFRSAGLDGRISWQPDSGPLGLMAEACS